MTDDQRIVVTGIGVVSALGHNLVDTWDGLTAGRSGVETIHLFDPHRLDVRIAAQVPDWEPAAYMPKKEARRMDRYSQFAVAAAHEAVAQAGLAHFEGSERAGVMVGTGIGGIITTEAQFRVLDRRGIPGDIRSLFGGSR